MNTRRKIIEYIKIRLSFDVAKILTRIEVLLFLGGLSLLPLLFCSLCCIFFACVCCVVVSCVCVTCGNKRQKKKEEKIAKREL